MSDLRITHGDALPIDFAVTIPNDEDPLNPDPVDLTGGKLWFTARESYSSPEAAIEKSTEAGGGIIVNTPATLGTGKIVLVEDDTSGLPNDDLVELVYDLQLRDVSGNVYTVASGRLFVKPEVTVGTPV